MTLVRDHRSWPQLVRGALVGFVPPAIVTLGALLPVEIPTTTAALLYVLAVVVAAAGGGLVSGLVASVCSFLTLNFFFTPPIHTFGVEKTDDLVALAVFVAVSATVGTMLSRVLEQRARAERREREARLLHHLGTRLRAGVPTEEVLQSLARSITELFGLARCEITSELADGRVVAERSEGRLGGGRQEVIPITVQGRELGRIVAVPNGPHPELSTEERGVIQTLATQIALAIDGMRLGSEAEEARMEAETNRLRAALFSSVTHDLRTPLASITASVSSLLEDESPLEGAARRDLLETIDEEAGRLNRVIGNLMDLSRMRAGAVTPSKAPAAVDELIEGVIARSGSLLKDHDIRLMIRENLPEISLDLGQLDQALTNVLENAARFTPAGRRITVAAARWRDGVQIRIADRGPGISRADRERVFEPFVRGESSTGTGLGLAIARAIVEAHGGTIRVTDEPGGGAAVVIELPGRP
ncbi:MAG TPA: ATP-binding protein [Actinomycetota bacterium]|nr:ATP-binding protein [Actinomycetota bacterium]